MNLFLKSKKATILAKQAKVTADKMHKLHKDLQRDIKFLSHHSVFYHN